MRRDVRWLAAGLLVACALRAGFSWREYHRTPPEARVEAIDGDSYDRMALRLLDRGEFLNNDGAPQTEREPFYPLVLAGAHVLFGRSMVVGVVLNILFGLLTCLIVYGLTLELWGDVWAARLAFAAACVYPEWIYFGTLLYRETLMTLLLALWAWAWFARERWGVLRSFLVSGACFGALSVIRSPVVPLGGVFFLLSAWRLAPRQWARSLVPFALCAVLFQAPWLLRNYRLTGRLVAGGTMGGSVMYMSLLTDYDHPEVPFEQPLKTGDDPVIREVLSKGLTLGQAEPLFYHAAMDVMRRDPGRFWGAFLKKVVKLWRPFPNRGHDYGHSYLMLELAGLASNVPLMLLGLFGLTGTWRRGKSVDFLIAVPAVMTVVFAAYWTTTRYRCPMMFVFMPLAGLAARDILGRRLS